LAIGGIVNARPVLITSTLIVILLSSTAWAQEPGAARDTGAARGTAAHVPVPNLEPEPQDVGSVDGILRAFYEVVSGPAGTPRQWGRDRTLYIPGVRFVALESATASPVKARVMDHQTFVDRVDEELVREGFYEREIHRVVHEFGNMAQAYSTYEMRASTDGPVIGRGINSLLLFDDGQRWWIAGGVWQDESDQHPIPSEFLPE
jgi:hypothetical protein